MCNKRLPINCIVPPHMLKAMLNSEDERIRDSAFRTLTTSERIRGEREILGAVRSAMITNSLGKKHRSIYDAKHKRLSPSQLPGTLIRDEDQAPTADPAVNQAYDGLGATYDFYKNVFGRNSIDGHGMRLVATVHFSKRFNNAFWNGKQMVFGDGDNVVFVDFTRSLDVIGHELTHGVTDFASGLEYHNQSGALNESMSDVFGSLVKQYAKKQTAEQADWLIGPEIIAPGIKEHAKALRSLRAPGTAYNDPAFGGRDPQPKHMRDLVNLPDDELDDFGGVHINSGIPNHAFFLVARRLGGFAWEQAGAIWYETLHQLSPTSDFQNCADITAQVAGGKFGIGSKQQLAVIAAWDEVGIKITVPQPDVATRPRYRTNGDNGFELNDRLAEISEELAFLATQRS
jgi:Zn-dependent metalloprotease